MNYRQNAVTAAAQALQKWIPTGVPGMHRHHLIAADEALLAATPFMRANLIADEVARSNRERDVILNDLGRLLEVLGLGDHARPESPHEVFLLCLAAVERLCAAPP